MKNIMLKSIFVACVMLSSFSFGQSPIDKVFEKYSGQDGFTAVDFSKEMFQMFSQMNSGSDSTAIEFKKLTDKLTGLKVLMFNFDSLHIVKAVGIYNDIAGQFPGSVYKELMTINEGRQNIRFLTKTNASGSVTEFVMLLKDRDEVGAISITGTIDLGSISRLTKAMNIQGMENLQKIKK